jgi:hypothetical protein
MTRDEVLLVTAIAAALLIGAAAKHYRSKQRQSQWAPIPAAQQKSFNGKAR